MISTIMLIIIIRIQWFGNWQQRITKRAGRRKEWERRRLVIPFVFAEFVVVVGVGVGAAEDVLHATSKNGGYVVAFGGGAFFGAFLLTLNLLQLDSRLNLEQ